MSIHFNQYRIFVIFLIIFSVFSIAKAMPIPPELAAGRLSIQASHSELNQKKGIAIFEGQVELNQENTHLLAQRLEITFGENNKMIKAMATGSPASYWNTSEANSSSSNGFNKGIHAEAEKIIYYPNTRKVELWGHAKASQNANAIEGPYIEYQLDSGHLISHANENARTTIILYPSEFQSTSKKSTSSKNTSETL